MQHIRQDITNSLENINKTLLPGKLKLWCLQFATSPLVNVATHYIRGLNYNCGEELPITCLTENDKCSKMRLHMTLKDSEMGIIRCGAACYVSPEAQQHCGAFPAGKRRLLTFHQAIQLGIRPQLQRGGKWW